MPCRAEAQLITFADQVRTGRAADAEGDLRLGVDLGTANIVLSVVDGRDLPVAGAWLGSSVVRDGVVVDWGGAVRAVRQLKAELEQLLAHRFTEAAIAIPPGIDAGSIRVFTNVLEGADLDPCDVVDEPVAAARALGLTDGGVIDIGHGTTGVSRLVGGAVELSTDEATGGHHMTLVIAGALRIDYDAAEARKLDPGSASLVGGLVRPTLEKMATIAATAFAWDLPDDIWLVGGSGLVPHASEVFSQVLDHEVLLAPEPLFPTPLGTAMRRLND